MTLSQKGAGYKSRNYIKDHHVLEALDDLASQVQGVAGNTNASKTGVAQPPSAPDQLQVTNNGGFAMVAIVHNNPPAGVAYRLEYSTTPNFKNPVKVDNGVENTWSQYLHGQTLYFRVR